MKNRIFLIMILAAISISTWAQSPEKVDVSDIQVGSDGQTISVTFTAAIDRKTATGCMTVVYAPFITDGQHKVSLRPIVVQGGKAKRSWNRREWVSGAPAFYDNGIYTKNGATVRYDASADFQPWMYDARIDIEEVTAGCSESFVGTSTLIAGILPAPAPEPVVEPEPVPEPVVIPEPRTTGEKLARTFSFVLPAEEFDEQEPIKFYNDERDNALTVYYHLNRYNIVSDYAANDQTLLKLKESIAEIDASEDSRVERVVIAGFASPEGSYDLNDRLAFNRARAIEQYLTENTDLDANLITLFNGSADWAGLRRLVEADPEVPQRQQVLDIINNNPVWDAKTRTGRLTLIRNLDGGETYDYLKTHLFPRLRNGSFIRIYYNDVQ